MPYFSATEPRVRLTMKRPDRNFSQEIFSHQGLSADEGKHGDGTLAFGMNPHANDIDPALFFTNKGYGLSFDLEIVVGSTVYPLNKYALVDHSYSFGDPPWISVNAVSLIQHTIQRRQMMTKTNALFSQIGVAVGTALDAAFDEAYTGDSTGYAVAYPWLTRSDIAPWTIAIGSFDAGATVSIQEESGGNLWLFFAHVLEKSGYALVFTESPANTFTVTGEAAYQNSDKSTTVIFSDGVKPGVGNGFLAGAVLLTDFKPMANTINGAGQGKETSQVQSWVGNSTSKTAYGIHESRLTSAGVTSTDAVDYETQSQVDALAQPKETWELEILPNAEFVLGRDFNRRTKVGFWHSSFTEVGISTPVTAVIIGWHLSADRNNRPVYSITLGDIPTNLWASIYANSNQDGPYASGNRFVTKAGW